MSTNTSFIHLRCPTGQSRPPEPLGGLPDLLLLDSLCIQGIWA